MSNIIDPEDILTDANCIECVFMAASNLDEATPLEVVADIARMKIDESNRLLDEYHDADDAGASGPAPGEPSAKPASRAARTKRTGK